MIPNDSRFSTGVPEQLGTYDAASVGWKKFLVRIHHIVF